MDGWKDILISKDTTILESLKIIDRSSAQIVLVVDADRRLLATLTDGDVRRGLLSGRSLQDSISTVMSKTPCVAREDESNESLLSLMQKMELAHIPLVNNSGQVVGLKLLRELVGWKKRDNWVVLMAGGLGSRLSPLTDECPKPMIKVGDKPILETILVSFIKQGFHRFYISINYLSEVVENYFGNGAKWGCEICYLREKSRLGTAGALSLIPSTPESDMIVMNGDLLTNMDYGELLDFHAAQDALATMCVRRYEYQIPYGVVRHKDGALLGVEEKPVREYYVNAGIYALSAKALEMVPSNEYYDITTFFDDALLNEKHISVFPVTDYWLDVGRMEDLEMARCKMSI